MDPCSPNININNARTAIRANMGVPKIFAKNLSRKQICNAFRSCQSAKTLPPMEIDIFDGYIYLIDSKSPLKAKHYHTVFERGTKSEVVSVAKKLGLVELDKSKKELVANIVALLDSLGIKEPIKALKIPKEAKTLTMNNFNLNRPANGNMNVNVNLNKPNGNMNMNMNLNKPNGNVNLNLNKPNGLGLPNTNKGTMPAAAVFTTQNEGSKGFTPGRPLPKGRLPNGVNKSGTVSGSSTMKTKERNKGEIMKRLNKIKEQLGVFSNVKNKPQPQPQPQPQKVSKPNGSVTGSTATVQHFYMGGAAPSSVAGSSAV